MAIETLRGRSPLASRLALGAMLLTCAWLSGCKSVTPPPTAPIGTTKKYLPPTSPDRVINNLEAAFELKDEAYLDSVLDVSFVFRKQPADVHPGVVDSLPRAEILSAGHHLFLTGAGERFPAADRIRLSTVTTLVADDNRIGHSGCKKCSVSTMLSIGFPNANGVSVNSPASLYFKQSPDGSGWWRLVEWRDEPAASSPRPASNPRAPQGIIGNSWSRLFQAYR